MSNKILFVEEKQVRKWVILKLILTANISKLRKEITRSKIKFQRSYLRKYSLFYYIIYFKIKSDLKI